MRTLDSHLSYYDRWAKSWEFQALLKARPIAGDAELGEAYVARRAAEDLDERGPRELRRQRAAHARARHRAHPGRRGAVPAQARPRRHPRHRVHRAAAAARARARPTTASASAARSTRSTRSSTEGYIGRAEAATFSRDYRVLRLLEHRMQLRNLRRTHLMPSRPEDLRVLARASGLADTGEQVWQRWESVKREVRDIHVRLFYRPLLSAVAALPAEERALSTAAGRTTGSPRSASPTRGRAAAHRGAHQRAEPQGDDPAAPDAGHDPVVRRRRRPRLRAARLPPPQRAARQHALVPADAARLVGRGREPHPGALGLALRRRAHGVDPRVGRVARRSDELLRPRSGVALQEEARAIQTRHATIDDAMRSVRGAAPPRAAAHRDGGDPRHRRRSRSSPSALTTITEVTIQATLRAVRREIVPPEDAALDFSVIAMGRFGGRELGFGSDADVMYVYRANGVDPQRAHELVAPARRRRCASTPRTTACRSTSTPICGPRAATARSRDRSTPTREYYRRWSLSWEAQALLRARGVAGSVKLIRGVHRARRRVRYPASRRSAGAARDQAHQGARRERATAAGRRPGTPPQARPGSLSDVEWLVQLLQLEHAPRRRRACAPRRRSTALRAAADAGLVPASRRGSPRAGMAAREPAALGEHAAVRADERRAARSTASSSTASAACSEYPPRSATPGRGGLPRHDPRARRVFEKLFYG